MQYFKNKVTHEKYTVNVVESQQTAEAEVHTGHVKIMIERTNISNTHVLSTTLCTHWKRRGAHTENTEVVK